MEQKIPTIIEDLYIALVGEPQPFLWPDYLRKSPIRGHGLWSFYQGLQIGIQLAAACLGRG